MTTSPYHPTRLHPLRPHAMGIGPTRRRVLGLAAGLAAAGLLAGCASEPLPEGPKPIRFDDKPKFRLNVARVQLLDNYQPPRKAPNVEHLFPTSPARAAGDWARDRLEAAGVSGTARLVIRDASVIEKPLPQTGGIRGTFTQEPADEYAATLIATLEILSETGERQAYVDVESRLVRAIDASGSPLAREVAFDRMTRDLLAGFDQRLSENLNTTLKDYVL
ncbi:MAG: hypothetical protein CMO29_01020 [Tistrella sp.]|nr:hypothetical protein [uncultured Tistrella sp.]MAM72374.1 hypothetical protein [Tistrella sp.]